jgi:hypothetical protein
MTLIPDLGPAKKKVHLGGSGPACLIFKGRTKAHTALESSRQGAHDSAITPNPPKMTYRTIWASTLDLLAELAARTCCTPTRRRQASARAPRAAGRAPPHPDGRCAAACSASCRGTSRRTPRAASSARHCTAAPSRASTSPSSGPSGSLPPARGLGVRRLCVLARGR